jgi:hypothetical protein
MAFTHLSKESSQSTQIVKDQSGQPKTQASLGLPSEVSAVPQRVSQPTLASLDAILRPDGASLARPGSVNPDLLPTPK